MRATRISAGLPECFDRKEFQLPDLQNYETTQLDLNAVRSLASRAAKEAPLSPAPAVGYINRESGDFIDVCGPHWLLDSRYEFFEESRGHIIEEGRTEYLYALMPDGALVKISISENFKGHREFYWSNHDDRHSIQPMREDDILSFDFKRVHYDIGDKESPQGHFWGNADRPAARGGLLLQSRKGAGLSLLLENIRTGRAEQGRQIPSQETADTRTRLLPDPTKFHHTPDKRANAIADLQAARQKSATEKVAREAKKVVGEAEKVAREHAVKLGGRLSLLVSGLLGVACVSAAMIVFSPIYAFFNQTCQGKPVSDISHCPVAKVTHWPLFTGYGWMVVAAVSAIGALVLRRFVKRLRGW